VFTARHGLRVQICFRLVLLLNVYGIICKHLNGAATGSKLHAFITIQPLLTIELKVAAILTF